MRTFYVAKEAKKRGYLKDVVCRGNSQNIIPKKFVRTIFPFYRIMNLGMTFIHMFIWEKFPSRKIQLNVFDYVCSKRIKKADLLHIYEYAPRTMKRAKELGMTVLLDTHLCHPRTSDKILTGKTQDEYELFDQVLKYADKLVVSSEFEVKSWYANGVAKKDLILVPGVGADLKRFHPDKRKKSKIFTCVFVGNLQQRKGIMELLEAWDALKLKDARLVICGRPHVSLKPKLNKYLSNKTIEFKGHVDPAPYYQEAHVFICPSYYEGSAKTLIEAMASGLPIITTFNAGPPFKDGSVGYIIPHKDVAALKKKILFMKKNPAVTKKLGERALKMSKDFTLERYGEKVVDIYGKFMKL